MKKTTKTKRTPTPQLVAVEHTPSIVLRLTREQAVAVWRNLNPERSYQPSERRVVKAVESQLGRATR